MADNEIKKRNTAYKLSIGLIEKGNPEFEKDNEGRERFRTMALNDKQVLRINVIANVIDKFQSTEKAYTALTIDDGTGNMRVKAFADSVALLNSIELGDTILVIGRLGYFNEEIYILPEIVKQMDARWLLARKLELTKEYGHVYAEEKSEEPAQNKEEIDAPIDEERIEKQIGQSEPPSLRERILEIIKIAEAQEGIDIENLIAQLGAPVDDIRNIVTEMLESGEIFESRPGRLRVL
jgi:RPA family protein